MVKSKSHKIAVGLSYDGLQHRAPILSLKERSLNADQVVGIAKRFGVPVVERSELAQSLSLLELDHEIPEQCFQAVALILSKLKNLSE